MVSLPRTSLPRQDVELARALLRRAGAAALATLGPDGAPFASHVVTAPAPDGAPLLLLSGLAVHTRNLQRDARASLLIVAAAEEGRPGSLDLARLTLTGQVRPDPSEGAQRCYLQCHDDARAFADFSDFAFYRFHAEAGHLIAGFGRIGTVPADLLLG